MEVLVARIANAVTIKRDALNKHFSAIIMKKGVKGRGSNRLITTADRRVIKIVY